MSYLRSYIPGCPAYGWADEARAQHGIWDEVFQRVAGELDD